MLAPMGLGLSETKTRVCHIDEGFDFLGWRIQRLAQRGRSGKRAIYTYPSKRALGSIKDRIRSLTRRGRHRTLADLLRRLNPALRGWCNYFRHGVSQRTFSYVDYFAFWRVFGWLHKRHHGLNKHTLVRRHLPDWRISDEGIDIFRADSGRHRVLPLPGHQDPDTMVEHNDRTDRTRGMTRGEPDAVEVARPVRRAGRRNPPHRETGRALRSDPYTR